MNEMEQREIVLKAELENILETYRRQRLGKENLPITTGQTMARITKALKTTSVSAKRVLVLEKLIRGTKNRINRGTSCYEILASLPAITYDRVHKYAKTSKRVILDELKREEELRPNTEYVSRTINGSELIEQLLEHFYESFKDLDRRKLVQLEYNYNQLLKDNTRSFGITKAAGEILGCLNTGMYGKNKNLIIKELNEDYRLGVKANERFISQMSDELLRYRLAALYATSEICKKRQFLIKPYKNSSYVDQKAYNNLKRGIYAIGSVTREYYYKTHGIYPKDEIIDNYIGGQLTIEGLIPKRDERNSRVR